MNEFMWIVIAIVFSLVAITALLIVTGTLQSVLQPHGGVQYA